MADTKKKFEGYYFWSIPVEERALVKKWITVYSHLFDKKQEEGSDFLYDKTLNALDAVLFSGFVYNTNSCEALYASFPLSREYTVKQEQIEVLVMRIKKASRYLEQFNLRRFSI